MTDDLGTLTRRDGRAELRFTRHLAHPPEKVWRALTEPEHLEAWFPTTIEGERAAGAPLRFAFRDVAMPAMAGEMLACEPPTLLEMNWGGDVLRFDLRPDGGGCVLDFTCRFDELGKAARDGAGWHACFDMLAHELGGTPAPWKSSADRWREVRDAYVERFGPEASSSPPPREWVEAHGPA